jgi:RNA polymerase sigma-70 factor (ECF subfamily)
VNICLESIWSEFAPPLKNFIRKRIKQDQDVEDILQNVFLKIHRNISSLKDADKIHAWVYSITRHELADFYRTRKLESDITEFHEDIMSESDEVKASINDEIAQCIIPMINQLPEKYKQALILTEFQNLTQKELSERMDLSVSGAKSRVQRARLKLKEMLSGCCQLEFDRRGNVTDYKHKSSDCKFC